MSSISCEKILLDVLSSDPISISGAVILGSPMLIAAEIFLDKKCPFHDALITSVTCRVKPKLLKSTSFTKEGNMGNIIHNSHGNKSFYYGRQLGNY